MRRLLSIVVLLVMLLGLWFVLLPDHLFLSTGPAKDGPRAAWVSKQWTANIAVDPLTVNTAQLDLTIAEHERLTAHKLRAHQLPDGTLTWVGLLSAAGKAPAAAQTLEAALNTITLVSSNGRITGTLRWNRHIYRLHPAANEHVLEEVNEAMLPPDHGPGQPVSGASSQRLSAPSAHAPGHATIRVLVVASKDAGDAVEDLRALAHLAIEESNQTYINSQIALSLELADFKQLDYVESPFLALDLNRLVATNDGYMDEAHRLRDELNADVVVLLLDGNDSACGQAAGKPANAETAFVVASLQCIGVSRFTVAHEIGHLLGASHQYVEGIADPFRYGHGFVHEPQGNIGWNTVMANVTETNKVRLPFWSDPDRLMDGVSMGDIETADNHRLLEETKWIVAGFR